MLVIPLVSISEPVLLNWCSTCRPFFYSSKVMAANRFFFFFFFSALSFPPPSLPIPSLPRARVLRKDKQLNIIFLIFPLSFFPPENDGPPAQDPQAPRKLNSSSLLSLFHLLLLFVSLITLHPSPALASTQYMHYKSRWKLNRARCRLVTVALASTASTRLVVVMLVANTTTASTLTNSEIAGDGGGMGKGGKEREKSELKKEE